MPVSKNDACDFLTSLHRHDLAVLIRECDVAIEPGVIDNGWFQKDAMLAVVHAPPPISEALNALPQHDRKRIGEAIASADPEIPSPQDLSQAHWPPPAVYSSKNRVDYGSLIGLTPQGGGRPRS